jgi:hypothetical protein
MDITVDWGAVSRRASVKATRSVGQSFLLKGSASTISLGYVASAQVSTWATAPTTPIVLTPVKGNTTAVTATIADVSTTTPYPATRYVRLDFDLQVTAGGVTRSVLTFKQLFNADASGALLATQFSFDGKVLKSNGSGVAYLPVPLPSGLVNRMGTHPLLVNTVGRIEINCEFVDLTELWWAVHKDNWGWYTHQKLGSRIENLYVLGWTGGGVPMLWFAVVPDAAADNLGKPASKNTGGNAGDTTNTGDQRGNAPASAMADRNANIVFFRPQPGSNAFVYSADERGLLDTKHDETTLHILARYLMSPLPTVQLKALAGTAGLLEPMLLADQIALTSTSPRAPTDPMPMVTRLWNAFRPVGLETAVNRSGQAHVLFLPLGFDGSKPLPQGGYDAALKRGLRDMLGSAMSTLIACNAVARKESALPDVSTREIWLAGHSAGNRGMWASLQANAADIDRAISFDATPSDENFEPGMAVVTNAVAIRKKASKTLELFAITTPNMTGKRSSDAKTNTVKPLGLDQTRLDLMKKTGAVLTVLPPYKQRESFWQLAPASAMTPFLRNLFFNWTDSEIEQSALKPANWNQRKDQDFEVWPFLFFHEMAVFGGRLVPSPMAAMQQGSTPSPPPPPQLITLFEDSLGAPDIGSINP